MSTNRKASISSKWLSPVFLTTVLLIAGSLCSAQTDYERLGPLKPPRDDLGYVSNEAIVTLRSGSTEVDLAALNARLGSTIKRRLRLANTYTLRLPGTGTTRGDTPVDRLLSTIQSDPIVATAQRNFKYYLSAIPNDTLYPLWRDLLYPDFTWGQWALQPDPDTIPVTNHIFAQQAWDIEKGRDDVVVAVVDSGVRVWTEHDDEGHAVRYPHPDLGYYKRDLDPVPDPTNPVRDYPNIYIPDSPGRLLHGYDFTDNETWWDESPSEEDDDWPWAGHGTHVAGIIAAKTNNLQGVASLCWSNVWILPLKVCPDGGGGGIPTDLVVDAIMYCLDYENESSVPGKTLRVDVINMSFGGESLNIPIVRSLVAQASRGGIVLVAGAGNSWDWGPWPPTYPAAYEDVICVSATDIDNRITPWSQRGAAVDLAAPGSHILSTWWSPIAVNEDAINEFYGGGGDGGDGGDGGNGGEPPFPTAAPSQIDEQPYEPYDIWGNGYQYDSGTSMAAPMVSAAAALLRSMDVPAREVKAILCETATPTGPGQPNDSYGWGLLNVYEAVKKAAIDVEIRTPSLGGSVGSQRPRFQIEFRRADPDTIRIWVDGVLVMGPDNESPAIADWQNSEIVSYTVLDEEAGKTTLVFDYTVEATPTGLHRIKASAESNYDFEQPPDPPPADEDEHPFRIAPLTLSRGWHLFCVPYIFSTPPAPEDYLGDPNLMLVRWNYATSWLGNYSFYYGAGGRMDPEASFEPPSVVDEVLAAPHDASTATPPTGVGYWLYVPDEQGYALPEGSGSTYEGRSYDLRVYRGWNMVGNPYAYNVRWANVVVEYGGTQIPISEAVRRGWLSPHVFRYDSIYRRYIRYHLNSAVMIPWEAQWLNVKVRGPDGWPEPDLRLIVGATPYTGPVW